MIFSNCSDGIDHRMHVAIYFVAECMMGVAVFHNRVNISNRPLSKRVK